MTINTQRGEELALYYQTEGGSWKLAMREGETVEQAMDRLESTKGKHWNLTYSWMERESEMEAGR